MQKKEKEIVEPSEVHDLLSDPQRVSILKALNRRGELTFTELMKHVDLHSGRLAFQLSKLEPLLIKTEEKKYKLSSIGYDSLQIVDFSEALLRVLDEHQYRGNVTVRKASLDDAEAIADINRSWYEKWLKFKGKIYEVDLSDLDRKDIELQAGSFSTPESVKNFLTKAHMRTLGYKSHGPLYVATVEEKVLGYIVFWWGLSNEPQPWGKRACALIHLHKEQLDLDVVHALVRTGLEVGRKLQANLVEITTWHKEVQNVLEKALEKYPDVVRIEYSRLRAYVNDFPVEHQAIIQRADVDVALSRKLWRNRSLTYAAQPSYDVVSDKECDFEPWHKLIRVGEKACALELFKEEPYFDEADLELYCEPEDWNDKIFVQEVVKAGVAVARKLGNKRVVVHIEKQLEPWFKELGFKEWKPETQYEKLHPRSANHEYNYLLKL